MFTTTTTTTTTTICSTNTCTTTRPILLLLLLQLIQYYIMTSKGIHVYPDRVTPWRLTETVILVSAPRFYESQRFHPD